MIVELISVGTELLLGNIVNTNAQYLSETCAKLGLNVYYQTTVGDNRERMKSSGRRSQEPISLSSAAVWDRRRMISRRMSARS